VALQALQPVKDASGNEVRQDIYISPRRQHRAGQARWRSRQQISTAAACEQIGSQPARGDYRNFEDEGFKVDNDENPMPKWVKDAKNAHPAGSKEALDFMDGMADNSHTNLTQG
jgi:hypothetical protein